MTAAPPLDRSELLYRAESLQGASVGELAAQLGREIPDDPTRAKGLAGQLIEGVLGATAGSRAIPDFPHLHVELKSIPLDQQGRALESTFVCTADLRELEDQEWPDSRVFGKLRCVLWVPVVGEKRGRLAERRIGKPTLWRPTPAEEQLLFADWCQLVACLLAGDPQSSTAEATTALQLRPKARNAAQRVTYFCVDGSLVSVVPQGFYLRARFTERLLVGGPSAASQNIRSEYFESRTDTFQGTAPAPSGFRPSESAESTPPRRDASRPASARETQSRGSELSNQSTS